MSRLSSTPLVTIRIKEACLQDLVPLPSTIVLPATIDVIEHFYFYSAHFGKEKTRLVALKEFTVVKAISEKVSKNDHHWLISNTTVYLLKDYSANGI